MLLHPKEKLKSSGRKSVYILCSSSLVAKLTNANDRWDLRFFRQARLCFCRRRICKSASRESPEQDEWTERETRANHFVDMRSYCVRLMGLSLSLSILFQVSSFIDRRVHHISTSTSRNSCSIVGELLAHCLTNRFPMLAADTGILVAIASHIMKLGWPKSFVEYYRTEIYEMGSACCLSLTNFRSFFLSNARFVIFRLMTITCF